MPWNKQKNTIKESKGDRIFLTANILFLSIVMLVVLYPLIFIVSSSFSSTAAVTSGKVWLFPVEPSLAGYKAIFRNNQILYGYANSIFYTVVGTAVNIIFTIMAAFPLSRKDLYGKNLIMFLFTFTMLFSGGLVPFYMVVSKLGMLDKRIVLILPTALAVFQVIIARTFFQISIPEELAEAAEIDGCDDFGFLIKIVIPLSGPIIAVIGLMYAVNNWNTYFNALIFLKSTKLFPLQMVLRNILIQNSFDPNMVKDPVSMMETQGLRDLLKYALIVVASVPVLSIYPFVQKFFVKGMLIGSIKG
ncbi:MULTISPECIES: carbohydrate ABC transporter permease [unclassified Oceanispirochaeta]|uniref:carbohydrate ABC transporter permease n=1 Tax=unclassified Oceanispirochaeta TaxID=2635722 RepID=UPI000E092C74|nr:MULTISPECIES: carbohydrate ABC transporter permease [unclassified Oceanispirochaeta]MBF9017615.1 carbohydrate ABC transporter permease [Oceanispirochaeta sp. M2]NPD74187.1 carbohydrate ABC transporter permease [Oceanispirochaeta sp. M1]RDG30016.1 carbohydrate ABC transporter permease [Oceanispirochaeta sp. M1]